MRLFYRKNYKTKLVFSFPVQIARIRLLHGVCVSNLLQNPMELQKGKSSCQNFYPLSEAVLTSACLGLHGNIDR